MPIIKPFSEELLTTDMVYGTSKGIDSMYEVYKMKNVHVDRCNKGADFATTEKVANSNVSKPGFSKNGVDRNLDYIKSFDKLPQKYVGSIVKQDVRTIRRKCKSILYWQLIIKGLRVQFVVSGLDLEAIPKKQTYHIPGADNKVYSDKRLSSNQKNKEYGITDAELRWVFRNRKVEAVQKGVQFWKTSTAERYGKPAPCEAPWDMEAYKAAWKEYELSIEKKRSKGVSQATEELFSLDGWIMGELGLMA